jgi:hypothetical protein
MRHNCTVCCNIYVFAGHLSRERWKRLRDNRKALRLQKTKSCQAASKMKAPKFEKELTFLVPYIFGEETRQSNISFPSTLSQDEQSNDDVDSDGTAGNNDTAHSCITDITAPSSPRASTDCVQQNRRKRTYSPEEPSEASVLQENLRSKKKNQPSSEDKLTNFFISMAQNVKTFPLRDQIETKGKLFQMVNATEMRVALMNSSFSENTNNRYDSDYHAQDSGDLQKYCQSAP